MSDNVQLNRHQWRLAERQDEYRLRMMELELACTGIAPVGPDPKAPIHGATEFVNALADMQLEDFAPYLQQFHLRGYCVVPDFLDATMLDALREGLAPLFDATARLYHRTAPTRPGDRQTQHLHNVLAKTDVADPILTRPLLRGLLAGMLGHDFIFNAGAVAMSPDPGCSPQGLHRDDGFFALLPRPHMPLVVTVAIALDNFAAANGATRVVAGSHLWPPERSPEPEEVQPVSVQAGGMLIWDGALLHGGGGNSTEDQKRRTLTANYTRGWLRTQFNQYLSIPRARLLSMPAPLQADLGYQRSALGLGACDMQDPLAYLRRLQQAGGDGAQVDLGRENDPS